MPKLVWCLDSVRAEARTYSTVRDFKYGSPGAYKWAVRNGVLKEVTDHVQRGRKYTREYIAELASHFTNFADFVAVHPVAVCRASEYGHYDALDHLERSDAHAASDYDAVYCWVVTSAANDDIVVPMPGYHLCKAGLTSARLGDKRPAMCAEKNEMGMELVGIMQTPAGKAVKYESLILSTGLKAGVPSHYDGYTEFRIFSDAELDDIRQLLCA